MSIASASLIPTLPVNGIQILNPALASSSLSTDANGNVVVGGATITSSPTINTNPETNISGLTQSQCEFFVNGKFINMIANISFSLKQGITPSPANPLTYTFIIPNFPLIKQFFVATTVPIPYAPVVNLFRNDTGASVLPNGATISLQNLVTAGNTNVNIQLQNIDMSGAGFPTTTTYTLTISGSYFSQ
jgi:hypothetical protein